MKIITLPAPSQVKIEDRTPTGGVRYVSDHNISGICSACGYRPAFEWPWIVIADLAFCSTPCRDARFRRFKHPVVEAATFLGVDGERYEYRRIPAERP